MSRAVKEWIGVHPDSAVPPRVRLRVFERHNGICHLSKRKIAPGELWELDHVIALCNGGEHRESNMAPALRDKHKEKTAEDVAEKSKTYHTKLSHYGLKSKTTKPGRGFQTNRDGKWKKKLDGTVVRR